MLWAVRGGGVAPITGGYTNEDFMNEAFLRVTASEQMKVTVQGTAAFVYNPKQNVEMDFALERVLCLLLVGEVDECRAWLGLDSVTSPYGNPEVVDFVMENSKVDDLKDLRGLCKLLETWLMEEVFPRFRDTKYIQFKLGDYYDDSTVLRYLERAGHSPLAAVATIAKIGAEATAVNSLMASVRLGPYLIKIKSEDLIRV